MGWVLVGMVALMERWDEMMRIEGAEGACR